MKDILEKVFANFTLTRAEAKSVLRAITEQKYPTVQVAAFLAAFRMRAPVANELLGFRDALLELSVPVNLAGRDCVEVCGTGGDNKNTFNISILAAFVIAGCGVSVAKHGNYAVSSQCGSSNILEAIGVPLYSDPAAVERQIERCGICFIHAPFFHPALKNVAPIRKDLGVRTFFNILGPLVNPACPTSQLVGVFSPELLRLYSHVFQEGSQKYMIVHSLDGYDEVSLTAGVKIIWGRKEELLYPGDLGFKVVNADQLQAGGTVDDAKKIFLNVLQGQGTEVQNNVVIANAGLALACQQPEKSFVDCFALARESLESKKAFNVLKALTTN